MKNEPSRSACRSVVQRLAVSVQLRARTGIVSVGRRLVLHGLTVNVIDITPTPRAERTGGAKRSTLTTGTARTAAEGVTPKAGTKATTDTTDPNLESAAEVGDDRRPQQGPDRRNEQGKPNPVGQKARGQHQGGGEKDHGPVGQIIGRQTTALEVVPHPPDHAHAFPPDQPGPGGADKDHEEQSQKPAKFACDLGDQPDLQYRQNDKGDKQPEHASIVDGDCGRPPSGHDVDAGALETRGWATSERLRSTLRRRCAVAVTDGFVDAMLEAPLGVTLLGAIEDRAFFDRVGPDNPRPAHGSAEAVAAALQTLGEMTFGELVELVTETSTFDAGPWSSSAPSSVAAAYRLAEARAPIAEAVDARFGSALHEPIDRARQQWWWSGYEVPPSFVPLFDNYEYVYDAGQFTWAGLWTVTDPPAGSHEQLIDSWEFHGSSVSRWHLPIDAGARVVEIHRPADWVGLVSEHPSPAASRLEHWELPSINQDQMDLTELLPVPGQRAARVEIGGHLVPDWRSVAEAYDGVHLSWAGFITAEGYISDLDDGNVAMLRYWSSERTHWLNDVFGDPRPAPAPVLIEPPFKGQMPVVDVRTDVDRQAKDRQVLRAFFGREDSI